MCLFSPFSLLNIFPLLISFIGHLNAVAVTVSRLNHRVHVQLCVCVSDGHYEWLTVNTVSEQNQGRDGAGVGSGWKLGNRSCSHSPGHTGDHRQSKGDIVAHI